MTPSIRKQLYFNSIDFLSYLTILFPELTFQQQRKEKTSHLKKIQTEFKVNFDRKLKNFESSFYSTLIKFKFTLSPNPTQQLIFIIEFSQINKKKILEQKKYIKTQL